MLGDLSNNIAKRGCRKNYCEGERGKFTHVAPQFDTPFVCKLSSVLFFCIEKWRVLVGGAKRHHLFKTSTRHSAKFYSNPFLCTLTFVL